MIELVDLSNWKKQKEILDELYVKYNINITSRKWRKEIEKWNKKWGMGEVDYCITHSATLGFKSATTYDDVMIGVKDYNSRIRKMYLSKKNMLSGVMKKHNYKINLDTGEIE